MRRPIGLFKKACEAAFVLMCLVAIGWGVHSRLRDLGDRPMHADEAEQGLKFAQLLDGGGYRYDPKHFHGPTLYYLALPIAAARGEHSGDQLTEATLRLLPVLAGLLTLLAPWLFAREMGWRFALLASALLALSPVLTYYQRYYVQEALLLCFLFALAGYCWRFFRDGSWCSALGVGISGGLLLATKESWPVLLAVLAVALATALRPGMEDIRRLLRLWPRALAAVGVALGVLVALYSSFGRHPQGVVDFVRAFWLYELNDAHVKPWHYYLGILADARRVLMPFSGESALALLTLLAMPALLWHRGLRNSRGGRMLAGAGTYGLLLFIIISALPYKTPWFLLIPLAATAYSVGATLVLLHPLRFGRLTSLILAGVLFGLLAREDWWMNRIFPADTRNPYAYVPTTYDALDLVAEVRRTAAAAEGPFTVVVACDNYWPLPWYLRDLPRIGYFHSAPGTWPQADIYIASPDLFGSIRAQAGPGLGQPHFRALRPGELLLVASPE